MDELTRLLKTNKVFRKELFNLFTVYCMTCVVGILAAYIIIEVLMQSHKPENRDYYILGCILTPFISIACAIADTLEKYKGGKQR